MIEFDGPCEPGSEEWERRIGAFLCDVSPDVWWWLSFADPELPEGTQFLGVCCAPGPNMVAAISVARLADANPGGQVAGYELPGTPSEPYRLRLFQKGDPMLDTMVASPGWLEEFA